MREHTLWLIVGLGNPGDAYAETRHNAGFMVVDEVASTYGIALQKRKFDTLYGRGVVEGTRVVLAKPMAFMNRSGPPVRRMADYFKLSCTDLIIVSDDIDLTYGRIKIKEKGGDGGHKGLKSIIDAFNSREFTRVRIGIGRSNAEASVTNHVLGRFNADETQVLSRVVERARDAVVTILCKGLKEGMNRFNNKRNVVLSEDGGKEWNL